MADIESTLKYKKLLTNLDLKRNVLIDSSLQVNQFADPFIIEAAQIPGQSTSFTSLYTVEYDRPDVSLPDQFMRNSQHNVEDLP